MNGTVLTLTILITGITQRACPQSLQNTPGRRFTPLLQRRIRAPNLSIIRRIIPKQEIKMSTFRPHKAIFLQSLCAVTSIYPRSAHLAAKRRHRQIDTIWPSATSHDLRRARAGGFGHGVDGAIGHEALISGVFFELWVGSVWRETELGAP